MKYFVLPVIIDADPSFSHEYYIKGPSWDKVNNLVKKYTNGILSTNQFNLYTQNIKMDDIKEIALQDYPHLNSREFALINERNSLDLTDLI